jgi:hypothetical protein
MTVNFAPQVSSSKATPLDLSYDHVHDVVLLVGLQGDLFGLGVALERLDRRSLPRSPRGSAAPA